MTLVYIVLATLAGGLLSVVIAASLTLAVLSRVVKGLVSLSAGVLLGTALLHILPEAFESEAGAQADCLLHVVQAAVATAQDLAGFDAKAVRPHVDRGQRSVQGR